MEISDAQFAQFVDRIMACRDAEDAAKEDTKRVYAEANDAGADKTALGLFVRAERMDGKQRSKANLRDATVDDYRERYRRGKASHVRVREEASENTTNIPSKSGRDSAKSAAAVTTPDHDPETGEITEPQPETAVQMHHSDEAAELPASEEGHTSLAGAEGIDDRHPITEQQSSPEAARDLAVPALNGQVATQSTEASQERAQTATGVGASGDNLGSGSRSMATAKTDVPDHQGQASGDGQSQHNSGVRVASVDTNDGLAEPACEPDEAAANIKSAPIYADPGIVTYQQNGPEPMVAHPYATCWPVNTIDVSGGVEKPIVKIGPLILDGRGRYLGARKVHTGPTTTMEYPTVQYDGDDDLADCITWNLASRPNMDPRALRIVAEKLAKLVPDRAEEIMERFGFGEAQEAAQ